MSMTLAISRFTRQRTRNAVLTCGVLATAYTALGQVPTSQMSFLASKDGQAYTATIIGANPFAPPQGPTAVHIVLIPTLVVIGSWTFDPTIPDKCSPYGLSPEALFSLSPLVQPVPHLTFNGVDIGDVQYPNGFRRAEFWAAIQGSPYYQTPANYTFAPPYTIRAGETGNGPNPGLVVGSGCQRFGVVSKIWLRSTLEEQVIPTLRNSGAINPSDVTAFLFHNVIQFLQPGPVTYDPNSFHGFGYHTAIKDDVTNTYQIYITADWDSTALFPPDSATASHEIAETMDDPYVDDPVLQNATPSWGNIGQVVKVCKSPPIWEVGDPLSAWTLTPIMLNGRVFHVQELAFFSWFYNHPAVPSIGAGGKFSGHGTYSGPAKVCLPGGTF